jgi:signal transduction histidine kinase
VAEDVCKALESKANRRAIGLRLDLTEDAGEFEGDAQAIRALLINLLDNSFDACSADKKKSAHQVVVSMRGHPDHVEFVVRDNGIGMDRETREKAFSKFFSSKGMAGTGLGLFIAGNIATKHGGTIELSSEQGEGTTFMVKIPRTRSQSEAA